MNTRPNKKPAEDSPGEIATRMHLGLTRALNTPRKPHTPIKSKEERAATRATRKTK